MKRHLSLEYTLPAGVLAPYVEALDAGTALASACADCGHVSFPPRARCGRCDCDRFAWTTLPGTADIAGRTDGPGGTFALVQFAGADTRTVVRLHEVPADAVRGRLIAPQDTLRGLWLGAEGRAAGKVD